MPDPDPKPPKPRAVSPARWLLMLLPSVPAILLPIIFKALADARPPAISAWQPAEFYLFAIALVVLLVLSVVLGFCLEKWRWGAGQSILRPIGFSLVILIANCLTAFAGCGVTASLSR